MTRARYTYIKVDDQLPESDKLDGLPVLSRLVLEGALVECWAYCHRQQTDGYIGGDRWHKLGNALGRRLILERRFAEPVDGGYQMRNYLRHNNSRLQIEAMVEQRRKAGAKGGAAKQTASDLLSEPSSNPGSGSLSNSVHDRDRDRDKTPLPPARGASDRPASGAAPRGAGRAAPVPKAGDRPPPVSSLCRRCGSSRHGTRYCPTAEDGAGPDAPPRPHRRPDDGVAKRGAARARDLLGVRRPDPPPDPAGPPDDADDIPF